MVVAMTSDAQRASIVASVAALTRHVREERQTRRLAAVASVSRIARATLDSRCTQMLATLDDSLSAHDATGTPPPLLRLAGLLEMEKPHTRLLAWLLDPHRNHRAGVPALHIIAENLGFVALCNDIEERPEAINLQIEQKWPHGAQSSKVPDILVMAPNAILLLENKLGSGESGDQYGPYRDALSRLAIDRKIPLEDARAHLVAPESRTAPENWGRTITYSELAGWLLRCAAADLPFWDRVLAFLVAEAFKRNDSTAERMTRARALSAELHYRPFRPADLRLLADLLPLPSPFSPGKTL